MLDLGFRNMSRERQGLPECKSLYRCDVICNAGLCIACIVHEYMCTRYIILLCKSLQCRLMILDDAVYCAVVCGVV